MENIDHVINLTMLTFIVDHAEDMEPHEKLRVQRLFNAIKAKTNDEASCDDITKYLCDKYGVEY